jgi:hypothetical protein
LKTAFLSRWTKQPVEVTEGKVLPSEDVRESLEQQRPITALTPSYSHSTLITDRFRQRERGSVRLGQAGLDSTLVGGTSPETVFETATGEALTLQNLASLRRFRAETPANGNSREWLRE